MNPNENLSRVVTLFSKVFIRIPAVCHIDNEWDKGLVDQIMGRMFTAGFDRLIAVSSRTREIALRYTRNAAKIVTIPTGVNPVRFLGCDVERLYSTVKSARNRFNIGTVGKLVRFKGQHLVIKVLGVLRDKLPPFNYIIIGDGPDRAELGQYAYSLGLEESVRFLGFRTDVPDLLSGIDLLVQPSETEANGLVVIEGMMAGLPVIATEVGGASEIMDGGRLGWLVKPGDETALASAILEVACMPQDKRRRLGAEARKYAIKHYSFEQTVRRTEEVYLSLVNKQGQKAC
ncbi:MAG TPA: glycosyltransferase family 4 protein [Thermodesulfobacteriaceae bacterium]|nr:glycosyltransferase family 4 protein [Thermodesulfobacteriaceae bacterium]